MLERVKNFVKSRFSIDWSNTEGTPSGGIDSIDQTGKRRVPRGQVTSLDDEIGDRKRKQLTLSGRSVTTNFELAAWAVRKHLDFVSSFGFQCKTGIKAFDDDVEGFVEWWSRPLNFDVTGRHGLSKTVRLMEAMACLDGDIFLMKVDTGHVQGIEGDRCLTPDRKDFDPERTYNGVETRSGRPVRYAIHNRERKGGLVFDRWVPTSNIFHHGFFGRFDQYRGVSPIVAALSRFQDVYEGFDYALQRLKLAQLMGIVTYRSGSKGPFGAPEADEEDGGFKVRLKSNIFGLDLEQDDTAEILESKTPGEAFESFSEMMISVALKALDIPFSFFDESHTNFYGSKAALTLYLLSAREKRCNLQELLRQLTLWRLMIAIQDGDILLPRQIKSLSDIKFKWVPVGIPWFDPRDIRGDIDAIKAGLTTRTRVCQDRLGADWADDIAPQLADEEKLIEELGLNVTMDVSAASIKDDEEADDVETTNGGVNR